jgi:hypothetical protein
MKKISMLSIYFGKINILSFTFFFTVLCIKFCDHQQIKLTKQTIKKQTNKQSKHAKKKSKSK